MSTQKENICIFNFSGHHQLGLTNQLNKLLRGLISIQNKGISSVVVKGFQPDLFQSFESPISVILDLKKTNEELKRLNFPILVDEISENCNIINFNSIRNNFIKDDVNMVPNEYSYIYPALIPTENIINNALSRLPNNIEKFDAIVLKFGIDEVIHYLHKDAYSKCEMYSQIIGAKTDNNNNSYFEEWVNDDQAKILLEKYTEDAIQFIKDNYSGLNPLIICSAVGKDSRHDLMIPYVERIIENFDFIIWNKNIPDSRREVCAMIDYCLLTLSEKHDSYPLGSTISMMAAYTKKYNKNWLKNINANSK